MKSKRKVSLIIAIATIIFVVSLALDLITKYLIQINLPNVGDSMEVIPGFFNFVFVKNSGAGWGILSGKPVLLAVISGVILILYMTYFVLSIKRNKEKTSILLSVTSGLIIGGCLGNMFDRIFLGSVRDFINLQFMRFPVFNVADIVLTIGVILLIIYFLFVYPMEEKRATEQLKKIKDNDDTNAENLDGESLEIGGKYEQHEQENLLQNDERSSSLHGENDENSSLKKDEKDSSMQKNGSENDSDNK